MFKSGKLNKDKYVQIIEAMKGANLKIAKQIQDNGGAELDR